LNTERWLRDIAALGGLAEMTRFGQRDQVTQLFDRYVGGADGALPRFDTRASGSFSLMHDRKHLLKLPTTKAFLRACSPQINGAIGSTGGVTHHDQATEVA
jgi:hypothetical protein